MTSALRRKRRTTARGRTTPTRTAVKLALLAAGLFGPAAAAGAQPPRLVPYNAPPPQGVPPQAVPTWMHYPPPMPGMPPTAALAPPTAAPAPGMTMHFQKDAVPPPAPPGLVYYQQKDAVPPPKPPVKPRPPKVREVQAQNPVADDDTDIDFSLSPPGTERLFRLESEEQLQERIFQEEAQKGKPDRTAFPPKPDAPPGAFAGRSFPPISAVIEPTYVCHRRLYFHEPNYDRYGWELGYLQPIVSAGLFYKDVLLWPYHFGTDPWRHYECSAGYCLPGSPVPLLLYPPDLSVNGTLYQIGVVVAIAALIP